MADFDFSQLQGLLQQFAPTDEDKKRALTQALASAGFTMLGARGVSGMQALGQGGQAGLLSYNGSMDDASKSKRAGLLDAGNMMSLQEGMQKMQDQSDFRKLQGNIVGQNPVVQAATQGAAPPPAPMGPPSPDGSMSTPGAPPAAPAGPPQPIMQSDGLARKRAMADAYRQQAVEYAKSPLPQAQTMAQTLLDHAEKVLPKIKDTKTLTQGGQRVVVNFYDDGSHEVLPDVQPDLEKLNFQDTGGSVVGLNAFTGAPQSQPIPKTQSPDSKASNAVAWANNAETKRRNDINEGDPAQIESMAQMIANGKLQPPSGFAAARPISQAIMARVLQINPDYSAIDYNTGKKAEADFSTGKNGNTVRSLNVAISHLDTLGTLADALHTGNVQVFNKLSQAVSQQTGNPAPTNFDAAKKVVADEIVKAIVGSGGGVADREQASAAISRANSPAQLKGVIGTYQQLMTGQLHGLQQQYETNTKRKDFSRFLSAETQRVLTPVSAGNDLRSQADKILSGG